MLGKKILAKLSPVVRKLLPWRLDYQVTDGPNAVGHAPELKDENENGCRQMGRRKAAAAAKRTANAPSD